MTGGRRRRPFSVPAADHLVVIEVQSVDREAGEDVEAVRAGRRVFEAVADGHDSLDVAGAADDAVSLRAGSGPAGRGDASRWDFGTTPVTWPASSRTGNALTRYSCRAAAIAANGVSRSTQIALALITSLTRAFIRLPLRPGGSGRP